MLLRGGSNRSGRPVSQRPANTLKNMVFTKPLSQYSLKQRRPGTAGVEGEYLRKERRQLKTHDSCDALPSTPASCTHYWLIDKPNGPVSRGICKFCHEVGYFRNSPVTGREWQREFNEKRKVSYAGQSSPVNAPESNLHYGNTPRFENETQKR